MPRARCSWQGGYRDETGKEDPHSRKRQDGRSARRAKLAEDEQTWVTVVKVLPQYEGDVYLTGIRNIEDVLTDGERAAYGRIDGASRAERSLVKTRI